jgi:hypothetical protein
MPEIGDNGSSQITRKTSIQICWVRVPLGVYQPPEPLNDIERFLSMLRFDKRKIAEEFVAQTK